VTSDIGAVRQAIAAYTSGAVILPRLLASLEKARRAHTQLGQPTLEPRGSIVVATLPGDVHAIGTALLITVLECAGYTVHDLGMQVPIATIIDTAAQFRADAIGLSALLVTSSRQMPLCVQALDARGLEIPVLVGGAAINRAFGRRSAILPDGRIYASGVFYCRDVFEGLAALDALTDPDRRQQAIAQVRAEIEAERDHPLIPAPVVARTTSHAARRSDVEVPSPPYWGARRRPTDLREVWQVVDRNTLFRFHWGGYRASETDYSRLVGEFFEPALHELTADALEHKWLQGSMVSGYFACNRQDNALLVFDGHDVATRLEFPRQSDGERLCLADYFRPVASGRRDLVALQAVTVGPRAAEYVAQLQRQGQYVRMLLVNGLASATAEALAEYAHQQTRFDLGLAADRGLRFSWGYAACPDLDEQRKVMPLLRADTEIGLRLTESDTLSPEHSTVAIVVHHPEAKYFSVR
jgi:5-methyltetrahydrofolate--homocysteine methyltransferase